jgi:hypothetical protein
MIDRNMPGRYPAGVTAPDEDLRICGTVVEQPARQHDRRFGRTILTWSPCCGAARRLSTENAARADGPGGYYATICDGCGWRWHIRLNTDPHAALPGTSTWAGTADWTSAEGKYLPATDPPLRDLPEPAPAQKGEWLIASLDDGVLRREPSLHHAVRWFGHWADAAPNMISRRRMSRAEYQLAAPDAVGGRTCGFAVRAVGGRTCGSARFITAQEPLYPILWAPWTRVERPW